VVPLALHPPGAERAVQQAGKLVAAAIDDMPVLIAGPTRVTAAGKPPKLIDEYVGALNTGESRLSVAPMRSPSGRSGPGQRPEFDESTLVLQRDGPSAPPGGAATVRPRLRVVRRLARQLARR
jgi:hypothetical protein